MVKRRLMSVSHQTMTHWMLPAKSESSKLYRFCGYRDASFEIQLNGFSVMRERKLKSNEKLFAVFQSMIKPLLNS